MSEIDTAGTLAAFQRGFIAAGTGTDSSRSSIFPPAGISVAPFRLLFALSTISVFALPFPTFAFALVVDSFPDLAFHPSLEKVLNPYMPTTRREIPRICHGRGIWVAAPCLQTR